MSAIADLTEVLIAGGMSPAAAAALVARAVIEGQPRAQKTAGAERTRRWRERHQASQTVTAETPSAPVTVTSQASPSVTSDNALLLTSASSLDSENRFQKERKKERGQRKSRLSQIRADWKIPDRARALGSQLGVDVDEVADRFRDYLASTGKMYADYDAGFCNFVRNVPKFNGGLQPNGAGNGARNPTMAAFDDLIARADGRAVAPGDDARDVTPRRA